MKSNKAYFIPRKHISLAVSIFLVVFLTPRPTWAFFSPETLELITSGIGSGLLLIITAALASIAIFLKALTNNIKILMLFLLLCSVGFTFGRTQYNYAKLKEINTYTPVSQSDLDFISYQECIENNYLNFSNYESIKLVSQEEMISFLTTVNTPPVILNIGYRDDTRFKNDIFIEPQYSELEDLYSKTQHLGKAEPIFIHCTGGGHTASMIAQMLAKEGYSDLNVLAFTPESLMSTMQSRGLRVEDFFVQEENSQETKAIIRISLKANANLLHERDSFFFYKVKNCQEYINLYSFLNSGNSICSSDFDPDFLNEKEAKTHFLCAQVGDCTYLQAVLQNTDSTHIGYLVLLYE